MYTLLATTFGKKRNQMIAKGGWKGENVTQSRMRGAEIVGHMARWRKGKSMPGIVEHVVQRGAVAFYAPMGKTVPGKLPGFQIKNVQLALVCRQNVRP